MRRHAVAAAAVVGAGALLTVGVAAAHSMPGRDTLHLARIVGLAGAAALVAGLVVLACMRRRTIGAQTIVAAVTTVVALGLGVRVSAREMFLSAHDAAVLDVVLAVAGTVGIAAALALAARVAATGEALVEQARLLGDGVVVTGPRSGPGELDRLARELEETSARLEESRSRERAMDRSRRELIAWVSHDLRTPLAGIRAVAEALADGVVDDPETVARYHASLREEAERLAGLVDDLFELARAQAGALRLQFDRVSLGDLVSDVVAGVAPVARAKGVRLEGRLDGPPPEVVCSAPEVLRALRNLLENAVRHTPADGTVTVEAGAGPDRAFVSIVDTGGGIPEEEMERIFEAAYRVDRARTPGDGGGGLGLTIAKGLVEAHRGEITVRNEGEGCRFTVHLPLEAVDADTGRSP